MVKSPASFLHFLLLSLIFPLISPPAAAQDSRLKANRPDIRSVSLRNSASFMAPPLLRLGTDDMLLLNFDVIGDDSEYLRARLVHCNADWEPSRLLPSEVVDGFNETEISDFAFSSNTFIHYVNYNLPIPSPGIEPLVSGNYIIQVYPEDDPDETILQVPFYVTENISPLSAAITTRTDRGVNDGWQQLEISADLSSTGSVNPYQDLILTIRQNTDLTQTRTLTHPFRTEGSKVIFAHDNALIFPAGNEYRRFETVRTDYPGMHVDSVALSQTNWQAWLSSDTPRTSSQYSYDRTQHGRYKINEYNSTEPDLSADYVTVHFSLDSPPVPGKEIYLDGEFALGIPEWQRKMTYDNEQQRYSASIPLKQGSYNYRYIAGDSPEKSSPSCIEGDFHETQNEYLINLYLRLPSSRADRLIATLLIST